MSRWNALGQLLGNVWKFIAGRSIVSIRHETLRSSEQNENERTFFVQDNGVGFESRYAMDACGIPGATIHFTIAKGQQ